MRETDFAYGVAHIRAHELSLLTRDNIESMISSKSLREAMRILGDKGWNAENTEDFSPMLEEESRKNWELISHCLPAEHLLDCMIIENDFHNLKAAVKTVFTDESPDEYFVYPTVFPPELIKKAVKEKDFARLPECMREAAEEAYDVLTRLGQGQAADIVIDRKAMETKLKMAEESGSELLKRTVALNVAATNIKIALRCADTGKSEDFMKRAMLSSCPVINIETLRKKALEGKKEVISYLGDVKAFSNSAELLKENSSLFSKCLDDAILEEAKKAKFTAFGIEPIFAYFIARETEIKNVRIILSLKRNGISESEIRRRVREVYV